MIEGGGGWNDAAVRVDVVSVSVLVSVLAVDGSTTRWALPKPPSLEPAVVEEVVEEEVVVVNGRAEEANCFSGAPHLPVDSLRFSVVSNMMVVSAAKRGM